MREGGRERERIKWICVDRHIGVMVQGLEHLRKGENSRNSTFRASYSTSVMKDIV